MIALRLHRAQPTAGTPTLRTTIVVDDEISDDRSDEACARRMSLFREEARALAIALRGSLPGGTIDALLVELLEGKLSQFVVPQPRICEPTDAQARESKMKSHVKAMTSACREVATMLTELGKVADHPDRQAFDQVAASIGRLLDTILSDIAVDKPPSAGKVQR